MKDRGSRWRRWLPIAVLALVVAVIAVGLSGCHGHRLPAELVPNHPGGFDFSRPPCDPAARPADRRSDVLVRYLGVSGLYVEWRGSAILTAPYFSSPGLWRVAFGSVKQDEAAIRRGLDGLPLDRIAAVLAGHSHYDHFADLPPILRQHVPSAPVYVNRSGTRMLAAFPLLESRVHELERLEGDWVRVPNAPIRFQALPTSHAGHYRGLHFAKGEVPRPWQDWKGKGWLAMKEGQTYAFLIDLLGERDEVRFRLHFQDAASPAPGGFPSRETLDEHPVDLAVVCLPGAWNAEGYPERLLGHLGASHVLITHYEDFFRDREKPLRFVATLRDGRAAGFVRRVQDVLSGPGHSATGPEPCTCGPCGEAWSMPLPGEWLRFPVR